MKAAFAHAAASLALLAGLGERLREVKEGPDGAIHVITDNQKTRLLRLAPDG